MAELFGFEIKRKSDKDEPENLPSIVSPQEDDGSIEVAPGGAYGQYIDLEGKVKNEGELVTRYRELAAQPEADLAIQDIVNEAIVVTELNGPVEMNNDELKQSDGLKKKIREEFKTVLKLLDFNNKAYDIFKRWYIDGRLYYHIVIDEKNPRAGIKDLRYIDPRRIRKISEPIKDKDPRTGAVVYKGTNEYYLYSQQGFGGNTPGAGNATNGLKIAKDSICYVHSGMLDSRNSMVLSHLHKTIKPANQLRMLEDAAVIYRITRAPERRVFYIDVGNLPKMKAEQYLRDMMVKHKNKLVYNAQTGEVRDDRRFMTMLEDFWLPRREGGRGTEITTLPGGQNLGEMEDVDYFRRKLYKALNVPITRMESETQFNVGRSSEITRDEIKFSKFITRLRNRFSILFDELLEIHLALKGITTRKEWKELRQDIYYDFLEDNHFQEMKEMEIWNERFQTLGNAEQYVGEYLSKDWVRKNILRLTDGEIEEMEKGMGEEKSSGEYEDPESEQDQDQDQEAPPQQAPVHVHVNGNGETKTEEFEVPKEVSDEEKELVKSMTR